eukprot:TRINITY_DN15198_c0_g1_i1.p1 TRINITY_DN15198_c0_g1~~TRINITY_DN15198_c0_g1_i1.p1  ORF type:complete len:395 (+),score=93.34 TRINITY_DN15198_c0_g1_i1:55-1239(+)
MSSQATDPRRRARPAASAAVAAAAPGAPAAAARAADAAGAAPAAAAAAEPSSKRLRVDEPTGDPRRRPAAAAASPAAATSASNAAPAAAQSEDLSAQIFGKLRKLIPGKEFSLPSPSTSSASGAAAAAPASASEELGSRLRDSLRMLMPTGDSAAALQSTAAGQQLFHVVQGLQPSAGAVHLQQLGAAAAPPQPVQATTLPRTAAAARPKRPAPATVEEEASDEDDGVPHRLPPGFGAVPEDIVEKRAREREEMRIRQIKSTQPCRFGRACKKRDCPNLHQEGREIDNELNLCSFGRRCKRRDCFYDHPDGRQIDGDPGGAMCKFGEKCRRPDCLYDHPPGREAVSGPDFRVCYFCHESGHIAQECPRNPETLAYQAALQDAQRSSFPAITAPV